MKIAGMCYKFHANCCLKIIFSVMLWWHTELVCNVNPNEINILTSKTLNAWQWTIILPRWAVITLVPESTCSCASSSHQTACMSIELSHYLTLSGENMWYVKVPVCLQEKSHCLHWLSFSTEWMSMCVFKLLWLCMKSHSSWGFWLVWMKSFNVGN